MTPDASARGWSAPRGVVPGKALAAVVVWGASFVVTRMALEVFNPFGLVAARSLAGAAVLLVLLGAGRGRVLPERDDRSRAALLGAVLGGHLLIQAVGLQYTSAVNTGWIIAVMPASIALGAHFVLGQRLRSAGWAGILVAGGGVLLVTLGGSKAFPKGTLGDLLQISSCVTWTSYTLAATRPIARSGALRVTALAVVVSSVVTAAATPVSGFLHAPLTAASVAAVAFLGIACSGLAPYLWSLSLAEHPAPRVGATLYFEPFVTFAVAVAALGEPFTALTLLGGAVVVAGVWLVGRAGRGA